MSNAVKITQEILDVYDGQLYNEIQKKYLDASYLVTTCDKLHYTYFKNILCEKSNENRIYICNFLVYIQGVPF